MKNREISEIAISPQSHNPRVFSPGAPAENLSGGRRIQNDRLKKFMQWKAPFLSRRSAPPQPSYDVVTFPVWKRGFGMNQCYADHAS